MVKKQEVELFENKKKEIEKPKVTAAKIKKMWDGGRMYKVNMGLTTRWQVNDKFVAGEQWSPIPSNQPQLKFMPQPVMNIVKQIVNFKAASVKGENVKMIFSPFGAGGAEGEAFGEDISDLGDLLNKLTSVTWEKAKMDFVSSRVVDRAAVTGIGIAYFYWDKSVGSRSKQSPYIGDVRAECLDAMYVVFGNPQELDVQRQPYIVVSGRKDLEQIRREAKSKGMSDEDIDMLTADILEDEKYSGSDIENQENPKITVYTYFWKEGGRVHYARSTNAVLLDKGRSLSLSLYPFAIFNWEERMDCIYGSDEVSSVIPNQKLVNGTLAMDAISKQLTGFPKMFIDSRYVNAKQITNNIGEIIRSKSANMPPGHVPISYIQPAQQTNAVQNTVEFIMQKTKDVSGANEAVTGEANTNNASAIMLLQKSSGLPTEDIRRRYYQYIEDIGNILVDFYKGYYTDDRLMQYKKSDGSYGEVKFNADIIRDVEFTIRSDIGASSVFADSNAISTLDKMVQLGFLGKVEYLKLLPKSAAPFKEELLAIWKEEAKKAMEIQEQMGIDAAGYPTEQAPQPPSIEEQMVSDMSAPPEEQPPEGQRLRLQEEYGRQGQ